MVRVPFCLRPGTNDEAIYNSVVTQNEYRLPTPGQHLPFYASSDPENAGGGTLIWESDGLLVKVVPFDEIVDHVSRGGESRISVLKVDCEGAEFPILLTSRLLDRIDRIVGEYHELRAQLPRTYAFRAITNSSSKV